MREKKKTNLSSGSLLGSLGLLLGVLGFLDGRTAGGLSNGRLLGGDLVDVVDGGAVEATGGLDDPTVLLALDGGGDALLVHAAGEDGPVELARVLALSVQAGGFVVEEAVDLWAQGVVGKCVVWCDGMGWDERCQRVRVSKMKAYV